MSDDNDELDFDDDEFDEEPEDLTPTEAEDLDEADPVAAPVTYSGQDFDIVGLVRRLDSDDVLIPIFGHNDDRITSAGFQRSFVWRRPQMDRFVESVLLGYPIPGIFLVRQADKRYLVLDGQQRLRTLQHFVGGIHEGKEFALANVAESLKRLTYKKLDEDLRRQFDDTFIQATIVSTDGSTQSLEAIYQIFERLNSGGTQLTPHEIRVALFAGPFIDFLEKLNQAPQWRKLYGKTSPRLRDQELILRILALFVDASTYRRPLKVFLNGFVGRHRQLQGLDKTSLSEQFIEASNLIQRLAGRESLRPRGSQLNSALTEAVFVGLMRRLASGQQITARKVRSILTSLAKNTTLEAVTTRATADEESVRQRLGIATAAFE